MSEINWLGGIPIPESNREVLEIFLNGDIHYIFRKV
jgi:hypothetical protein